MVYLLSFDCSVVQIESTNLSAHIEKDKAASGFSCAGLGFVWLMRELQWLFASVGRGNHAST